MIYDALIELTCPNCKACEHVRITNDHRKKITQCWRCKKFLAYVPDVFQEGNSVQLNLNVTVLVEDPAKISDADYLQPQAV